MNDVLFVILLCSIFSIFLFGSGCFLLHICFDEVWNIPSTSAVLRRAGGGVRSSSAWVWFIWIGLNYLLLDGLLSFECCAFILFFVLDVSKVGWVGSKILHLYKTGMWLPSTPSAKQSIVQLTLQYWRDTYRLTFFLYCLSCIWILPRSGGWVLTGRIETTSMTSQHLANADNNTNTNNNNNNKKWTFQRYMERSRGIVNLATVGDGDNNDHYSDSGSSNGNRQCQLSRPPSSVPLTFDSDDDDDINNYEKSSTSSSHQNQPQTSSDNNNNEQQS